MPPLSLQCSRSAHAGSIRWWNQGRCSLHGRSRNDRGAIPLGAGK